MTRGRGGAAETKPAAAAAGVSPRRARCVARAGGAPRPPAARRHGPIVRRREEAGEEGSAAAPRAVPGRQRRVRHTKGRRRRIPPCRRSLPLLLRRPRGRDAPGPRSPPPSVSFLPGSRRSEERTERGDAAAAPKALREGEAPRRPAAGRARVLLQGHQRDLQGLRVSRSSPPPPTPLFSAAGSGYPQRLTPGRGGGGRGFPGSTAGRPAGRGRGWRSARAPPRGGGRGRISRPGPGNPFPARRGDPAAPFFRGEGMADGDGAAGCRPAPSAGK